MTVNVYGFKTISHIGSVDGSAGTNRSLHAYVTNDDDAAVEASNYFDAIYKRLQVGDIILASLDMDGTPAARMYVVSAISSGAVTVTPSEATAIT